jgi:hypothetical protein
MQDICHLLWPGIILKNEIILALSWSKFAPMMSTGWSFFVKNDWGGVTRKKSILPIDSHN